MSENPRNVIKSEWRDADAAVRYLEGQGYLEPHPDDPEQVRITNRGRAVLTSLAFWSPQTALHAAASVVAMRQRKLE